MGIDYYGVLGLTHNCDDLQIKRAYRRLAIETNPERHAKGELKEVFVLIGEAYDVLSQPKWRAVYDQYGEEGLKKGVPSPQGWIPPYSYHGDPVRTYREFFGTSSPYADLLQFELPTLDEWRGRALKKKGPSLVQPLQLTLKELYLGTIKKMKIKRRAFADDLEETTTVKYEILTIPIKPGLPPGTEIVFPEKGDCGHSVIPGDIIFVTEDLPHSTYRRQGVNLWATFDIDLKEALTGKTIVLETLDQRQIRVPITQVVYQDYVKSKGEGTVFSLRSRRQQDSYLSVELGGPEAIKIVHSGRNGTQTILVPASLGDGNWHYLALGIQDDSSVRSYVDCRWVSTDILRRNELDTPDDADLVIGYLFSGDLEQLVIVPDPRAVSQQCSATKQPSLDPLLEATRPRRPSAFVRKALLASNEFPGVNSEITATPLNVNKLSSATPPPSEADSSSWQDLDTDITEEGSGQNPESNDQYEVEWSEWSRCGGGECGGSGHQTRTSRCVDTGGGWLELCLESGAERTQTRACTMPPCNHTNLHNIGQGSSRCECRNRGVCVATSTVVSGGKRRLCRCAPGFGGRRCENFACHPRCLNGGSCVAPNTCSCTALYHGSNCQTAICDPPCENGGQCVAPQQCLCPPATSGNNCQNYTCRGGCLNGGLCVGPDLCECQNNSTGPRCAVPVCEPPCENGATCAVGNICLCAPHTSGTRCHTKKCDYRPIQEPYTRGYRRLVKKHLQTKCETWTWKTCVRTLPEYQTVYKTYYRTVYKCVDQL